MHASLRPVLFAALLCAIVPASSRAAGRAYIEISGANFKPLPLAISTASGPKEPAALLSVTLRDDLAISGLFQLLDPKSFLADEKSEGLAASSIEFSKWSAIGADSLVKTAVTGDDKAIKVEYRLFDVVNQKEALKASFSGRPADARLFAHQWADKLVEFYTGEKGIFRTRLVFVRKTASGKELWQCDFDGRNPVPLTSGGGLNLLPSWNPNGRSVLFTSYRDGSPMLYTVDVGSRAVKALPARGDLQTGGVFSPDGKRIAFTMSENGNSDIYVMNADGTGLVNLTNTRETESTPSWSPDSKRLAFVSTRSGDPQLFVMNADGTGAERLTFQGRYNQTPEWSPRGDLIAFTARDERLVFDLFALNVETRKIQRLTQDQGLNEEPTFSPNGRHIVFASTREGGRKRLWIMNADGTNQRLLGLDGDAYTPAWGPWGE